MNVKNSLSLLVNNINLSFKALLYNLVVVGVFSALLVVVVELNLSVITGSAEAADLIAKLSNSFGDFIGGNYDFINELVDSFSVFLKFVGEHLSSVFWAIGLGALIIYVESVLLGVGNYTITKIVDAHMATISKLGFFETLISSLNRSLPFEALYALIKTVGILLLIGLLYLIFVLTIGFLSLFSLILVSWIAIFLVSLFFTVTALFRPSVINGTSVTAAFKTRISGKQFWIDLGSFVLSITVAIVINIMFFLTTFGAGVIISISLTGLYFACLQLVIYYSANDKKYYIDFDNIVTPKGLREDKELLDKVDIE